MKKAQEYKKSFIIIIPGIDKLVPPKKMFEFFNLSESEEKEILYYPNCWHGIFAEEEVYDIMPRITNWVNERIKLV